MRILKLLFIFGMFNLSGQAQITNTIKPHINSPWHADSIFIGSGFIAKDSTKDLIVSWKGYFGTNAIGEFYFMVPNHKDSSIFLFHNVIDSFPTDPLSVNLGKFPKGTPLTFMYKVTNGDIRYTPCCINEKLYSGQDREGIDYYVSERSDGLNRRFFASGRVDSNIVEGGVEDYYNSLYLSLFFQVSDVYLEVREKYKTSSPVVSPLSANFDSQLSISAFIPYAGNYSIVGVDTINKRPDSSLFKIYYTLDGSNPLSSSTRLLFKDSITISQTTTLRAVGVLENDTNWFPSEIVTQVYTKVPASIRNQQNRFSFSQIAENGSDFKIYSISGKQISIQPALNRTMPLRGNIPRGVYLVKSNSGNGVSSVKKVFVY
jgi:Chitobiase/beta-hexosaminidase C-terminal domain